MGAGVILLASEGWDRDDDDDLCGQLRERRHGTGIYLAGSSRRFHDSGNEGHGMLPG